MSVGSVTMLAFVGLLGSSHGMAAFAAQLTGTNSQAASQIALEPGLFDAVQDKTLGIREEEADAYYLILNHAAETDDRAQIAAASSFVEQRRTESPELRDNPERPFPAFVDLFQNYTLYRGVPVTLEGHVRRVVAFPADPENPYGLQTLYEAWLYTDDSQSNPAVVVCTQIPEGMPIGEDLLEQASVTGYFFKMYGYRAQDTTRIAPLLLAGQLEWIPTEESAAWRPSASLYVAVAAIVALLVWSLVRAGRRDRDIRKRRLSRDLDDSPPGAAGPNSVHPDRSEPI